MNVLSNYGIKMNIKTIHGRKWKGMSSSNYPLTNFLLNFDSREGAEELLNRINKVLDGTYSWNDERTQGMNLGVVTPTTTKIYDDEDVFYANADATPDFELPTSDLKVIVEAWKNYLSSE